MILGVFYVDFLKTMGYSYFRKNGVEKWTD